MNREKIADVLEKLLPELARLGVPEVLGSYALGKQDPKDVDILLVIDEGELPDIVPVFGMFNARVVRRFGFRTIGTIDGVRVEVFPAKREYYGAARQYLAGPRERNIALRKHAKELGMRWQFWGLFDVEGKMLPCSSEQEFTRCLHQRLCRAP